MGRLHEPASSSTPGLDHGERAVSESPLSPPGGEGRGEGDQVCRQTKHPMDSQKKKPPASCKRALAGRKTTAPRAAALKALREIPLKRARDPGGSLL